MADISREDAEATVNSAKELIRSSGILDSTVNQFKDNLDSIIKKAVEKHTPWYKKLFR
jgi:hypothetical protein